jgi:hypothetical protein
MQSFLSTRVEMDSAQGKALLLFQYFIMDDIQSVVILDFYFPCFSLVQFITLNKITLGTPLLFSFKKIHQGHERRKAPLISARHSHCSPKVTDVTRDGWLGQCSTSKWAVEGTILDKNISSKIHHSCHKCLWQKLNSKWQPPRMVHL